MAEKHIETLLQSPNAFSQNMQHIFSNDRNTIVQAIEKCLDDDTMFELQNNFPVTLKRCSLNTNCTNQSNENVEICWLGIYAHMVSPSSTQLK